MLTRNFCILLLIFLTFGLTAQEVVIHSKKSDEAENQLKTLIEEISEDKLLKSFLDGAINVNTEASSAYDGKSYPVPEDFNTKADEIASKIREALNNEGREIKAEEREAKVPALIQTKLEVLKKTLETHANDSMKDLINAVTELQKESLVNNSEYKKLLEAEPRNVEEMAQTLLKKWKSANKDAVIKTSGKPIINIKEIAEANLTKEAAEKNPMPSDEVLKAAAEKEYPLIEKGQKISITWSPRPNNEVTVTGTIAVVTEKNVVFTNREKILIRDIKDEKIKEGLSKTKTAENRAAYIRDKQTDVMKARSRYFAHNLQGTVNEIIAENEKKGYILAEGEWQPTAKFVTAAIEKKLSAWKKDKAANLDKAILKDNRLMNFLNSEKQAYTAITEKVYLESVPKFETDKEGIVNAVGTEDLTDDFDDFGEIDKAQEEKDKLADAAEAKRKAEAAKINKERATAIQAEKDKREAEKTQGQTTTYIMIGVVLLIIGGAAFVFLNPTIREKILGGKKKKMTDVVANLQSPNGGPGTDSVPGDLPPLTMPGSAPPPPGAPSGVPIADNRGGATQATEKTQIDLDDDLSIERGGEAEEGPTAAPRKKISLNLGGTSTPLAAPGTSENQESTAPPAPGGGLTPPGGGLTPPGGGLTPPGGGLTPPGGGLTPPGGGLTPPGDDQSGSDEDEPSDKSNLILNPNLDGGSKLRLKK